MFEYFGRVGVNKQDLPSAWGIMKTLNWFESIFSSVYWKLSVFFFYYFLEEKSFLFLVSFKFFFIL